MSPGRYRLLSLLVRVGAEANERFTMSEVQEFLRISAALDSDSRESAKRILETATQLSSLLGELVPMWAREERESAMVHNIAPFSKAF